jgi:hypothetical protein
MAGSAEESTEDGDRSGTNSEDSNNNNNTPEKEKLEKRKSLSRKLSISGKKDKSEESSSDKVGFDML